MSPAVWPVIHLRDDATTRANAELALSAGAEGVFLIHMDGNDAAINPAAAMLRREFPALRLGVNYLTVPARDALDRSLAHGWDATWSDSPGVRSDAVTADARAIGAVLKAHPSHAFFGSVAFKYQKKDPDPAEAARQAWALGMIPTTSGSATGQAPAAEHLARIRDGLPSGAPLAVASGITPGNIAVLGPYVTHVLVATGIGEDFYRFSPDLLRALIDRCTEASA